MFSPTGTRKNISHRRLQLEPLERRELLAVGVVNTVLPLAAASTASSVAAKASAGHTFAQAIKITLLSNGTGTQSGRISTVGQVNVYDFIAPLTGTMTIWQVAAQGSPLYSLLKVYNANQTLLAHNSGASVTNFNCSVQISVTAGARYYVQAAGFIPNSGTTGNNGTTYNETGAYVLKFSTARPARVYPDTFDTAQSIKLTGYGNGSQAAQLYYAGDSDMFKFVAPSSGIMTIQELAATGSGIDPFLYLYGGNQKLVWSNDDHDFSKNSFIQSVVAAGATYYVEAAGFGNTFGAYTLTFSTMPNVGVQYTSTFPQAWPLPLQSNGFGMIQGNITFPGNVDMFKIVAPATGNMTIREIAAGNSTLDSFLRLYDASGDGIPLASNDDDASNDAYGGSLDSRIDYTVTAGATYYIAASGINTGAYTLLIDMGETAPPPVVSTPQNYAVLYFGADNAYDNLASYYHNLVNVYDTLTASQYGYNLAPADIYILYADGSSSSLNRVADSGGISPLTDLPLTSTSDLSFAAGSHVVSATPGNLQYVLGKLAADLNTTDDFLFYAYGQGGGLVGGAGMSYPDSLTGWGSNSAVYESQLSNWLPAIPAANSTYLFSESFGGGMLQDLENSSGALPAGTFGAASTNYYEPTVEPTTSQTGFAEGLVTALQDGYRTTANLFGYALGNDNNAATPPYAADGGTYSSTVEHPWEAGSDFRIFLTSTNTAPVLTSVTPLVGAVLITSPQPFKFGYNDLAYSSNPTPPDADGDQVEYRIDSVTSGSLTDNGTPVAPGTTMVRYDDSLVWTPPPNEALGTANICTVEEWDGLAYSGTPVQVSVIVSASNYLNLHDSTLATLVQSLYTKDGQITRADMIKILQSTVPTPTSKLSLYDFEDLQTIVTDGNPTAKTPILKMPSYVYILAEDVIGSNPANAVWTGGQATTTPLGNMKASMPAAQVNELIGKWFLGTDWPMATYTDVYGNTQEDTDWTKVNGVLFAAGAPSYLDMNQGQAGDCYLISSLGAIANSNPTYIESMFLDNGDGTYTVRFYNPNTKIPTPDYVTVDTNFPIMGGTPLFDGETHVTNLNSSSNVLWIMLAEKAYAEWNAVGNEQHGFPDDGSNSYGGIGDGGWADSVCTQVLGATATGNDDYPLTAADETTIEAALKSGQAVTIGTGAFDDTMYNIYGGHEYMLLSYSPTNPENPNNDTFVMENPWGNDQGNEPLNPATNNTDAIPWSVLVSDCDYFSVAYCSKQLPVPINAPAQANSGSLSASPLGTSSILAAPNSHVSAPILAVAQPAPTQSQHSTVVDSSLPAVPKHRPPAAVEQPSREQLVDLVLQTHPDWGLY